jgi:hypothetical protein
VLEWNVGGRSELELYDLASGKRTPCPRCRRRSSTA